MSIDLSKDEVAAVIPSLKRYVREELELELSELRAGLLLSYIVKEIGPIAYNRGVKDAEVYFRGKVEDLSASCFEPEMTYWPAAKSPHKSIP